MQTAPVSAFKPYENVRLLRLTPEQACTNWLPHVLDTVRVVLPQVPEDVSTNFRVFRAVNEGALEVFLIVGEGETDYPLGMLMLTPISELFAGDRKLLIWSALAWEDMSLGDWKAVYRDTKAVAKRLGCSSIVAQSTVPRIMDIVKSLGGVMKQAPLELGVD